MIIGAASPFIIPQTVAQSGKPADPTVESEENAASTSPLDNELTPEEEKQVQELKKTDQEVRAHEQAHKSAAGPYAGPVSYETVTGPDGRQYAVGGEVDIDASPIPDNPEATIRKMDIVIRAALAPAQPSPQDFAVARAAQQARAQAQQEVRAKQQEEQDGEEQSPLEEGISQAESDQNQPNAEITQAIQNLNQASTLAQNSQNTAISVFG